MNDLRLLSSFVILISSVSVAAAQTPTEEEAPVEEPVQEPVEEPAEEPAAATPAPEGTIEQEASAIPGAAVGIGIGWTFPADLTIPDTASVRFRLASGLTFEVALRLALDTTSDETNFGGIDQEDRTAGLTLAVAALARKPLATRGRLQLVLLLGAGAGVSSFENDPDGPDNETNSTAMSAIAVWGLGIDWFVRPGWSISLSATNPLFLFSRTNSETNGNESTSTDFSIAAEFDPTVQAMVHIYY
jgi:hypothetical protein